MTSPKVSVLIPIYGVEKYIERCAHSLFNQTMIDDIEFIFVNDCTPDESMTLLQRVIDQYPHRKGQITIINHEKNQGLAVARVTALMAAKGDYVIHCDSDDWVDHSLYERMYSKAIEEDADIVVCSYVKNSGKSSTVISQELCPSREENAKSMLLLSKLHTILWNRLIKRSFYLNNQPSCPPEISLCEDVLVTIPLHLSTEKVSLLTEPVYYYYNCNNSGSLTQEFSIKTISSINRAMEILEDYLVKNGYESLLSAIDSHIYILTYPLLANYKKYNPQLWLDVGYPHCPAQISGRGRIAVWLVTHRLFKINWLFQYVIHLIFRK